MAWGKRVTLPRIAVYDNTCDKWIWLFWVRWELGPRKMRFWGVEWQCTACHHPPHWMWWSGRRTVMVEDVEERFFDDRWLHREVAGRYV